jgi:hypothetical protein
VSYNLTEPKKDLITRLVDAVRKRELPEEFLVSHSKVEGWQILDFRLSDPPNITQGALEALEDAELIKIHQQKHSLRVVLKGKAFEAVDSNFAAPDTSFVQHLTPLADVTNLDPELKQRCLPILGAGGADPTLWDSAVRTALVVLEERIRQAADISDPERTGRDLVNDVFGDKGNLSQVFESGSEKQGYRDLYAGVVGVLRNRYAHRLIDPTPEDGGALIVFINLLLKMTDDLQREEPSEAE